jgi:hypothetical protein
MPGPRRRSLGTARERGAPASSGLDSIPAMEIAEALRARLAAAGLEPPDDALERERLERDLAVHLARVAALGRAAELRAEDAPYTDPTRAAGPR